ncbi:hypothetical protein ACFQ1S_01055, partial [Kibdelosporangium lantanae]
MSGHRSALEPGADAGDQPAQRYPGERLGLPESGPGSVSGRVENAWHRRNDLVGTGEHARVLLHSSVRSGADGRAISAVRSEAKSGVLPDR